MAVVTVAVVVTKEATAVTGRMAVFVETVVVPPVFGFGVGFGFCVVFHVALAVPRKVLAFGPTAVIFFFFSPHASALCLFFPSPSGVNVCYFVALHSLLNVRLANDQIMPEQLQLPAPTFFSFFFL